VIDASASGNADLEIAAADRRANLFRRIFDLEIEIRAGRNGKA
jgi:hypothetical protein